MKIRLGFVANSSSSSFIIGFGSVNQKKMNELKNFINDYLNKDEYCLLSVDDIKNNSGYLVNYNHEYNKACIGFIEEDLPIDKFNENDLLLIVSISNDEGDSYFYDEEDDYELDYSIADQIDFYNERQQKIINMLSDGLFFNKEKPSICSIGAARNG